MIAEYAIEPTALSEWQNFRYIYDQLGVDRGRVVSELPKDWAQVILVSSKSELERKRMAEIMRNTIKYKTADFSRSYDSARSWCDNARSEHLKRPFRLIVIENPNESDENTAIASQLDESDARWRAETTALVPKRADRICGLCRSLLEISSEIAFVDPHFSGKRGFQTTFKGLFEACFRGKEHPITVSVLAQAESRDNYRDEATFFEYLGEWQANVNARYESIIPRGKTVVMVKLEKPFTDAEGYELHDRFILTNKGGLHIGWGFDEAGDQHGSSKQTCVSLMGISTYEKLREMYMGSTARNRVARSFSVTGR